MNPYLDRVIDQVLAAYSAVEPRPGVVPAWLAHAQSPPPARRLYWSLPVWAALVAVLLLILGLSWYRAYLHAQTQARLASHERTILVPLPPADAPALTPRDKQLIQLMQTDPGALATQKPDAPPKGKHEQ